MKLALWRPLRPYDPRLERRPRRTSCAGSFKVGIAAKDGGNAGGKATAVPVDAAAPSLPATFLAAGPNIERHWL